MFRRSMTRRGTALAITLLAGSLLASAACRGDKTDDADQGPVQSYTVRGEVVAVPGGGGPNDQLRIHHEAVPDFVGIDGDVVGMSPMTMPFPTADTVDVAALAPGDKVEFTFEVRWQGSPGYRISQVRKLPPDTQLDFSKGGKMDGMDGMDGDMAVGMDHEMGQGMDPSMDHEMSGEMAGEQDADDSPPNPQ